MLPAILANPVVMGLVVKAVEKAISSAVSRPDVPLNAPPSAQAQITEAVAGAVVEQLGNNPAFTNATNSEPFWQSRIFWSQIIGLVLPLVGGVIGIEFTDYGKELIIGIALSGSIFITQVGTFWARFGTRGKAPLFSGK